MRNAAALVLVTEERPSRVLWARRADSARFLPGFYTVPGGALDDVDARMGNDGGQDVALRVAALRELFEETGVLLATPAIGAADVRELRAAFQRSTAEGAARFAQLGLTWPTAGLEYLGRWVPPEFATTRFDTRFFAMRVGKALPVEVDQKELSLAEWISARDGLRRWGRAELRLGPPVAAVFRSMERHGALVAEDVRKTPGADGSVSLRYEVVPGIQSLPLRTPTLPPATHTNTFIVGTGEAVLVEPASPYKEDLDMAVAWVEENARHGVHVKALVATHHHPDHIGGAVALKERLGLPLWAHELTEERLRGHVAIDRILADNEEIELDGPTPMRLRGMHTPGHAPGHLCFAEPESGALIAGDMIAGIGTIIVEPVDGDMELYLASLRRMAESEPTVLLPAHGGPIDDVAGILEHYVNHRLAREAKVFEALRAYQGPASPAELLPVAYADTNKLLWPLAAQSTAAHLIYLERQGRAERVGDKWRAVA